MLPVTIGPGGFPPSPNNNVIPLLGVWGGYPGSFVIRYWVCVWGVPGSYQAFHPSLRKLDFELDTS